MSYSFLQDFQKDIVRAGEAFTAIGYKQIETGEKVIHTFSKYVFHGNILLIIWRTVQLALKNLFQINDLVYNSNLPFAFILYNLYGYQEQSCLRIAADMVLKTSMITF